MIEIEEKIDRLTSVLSGALYWASDTLKVAGDKLNSSLSKWSQVRQRYEERGKIAAIKLHRDLFESRLADAKDEVEARAEEKGWKSPYPR